MKYKVHSNSGLYYSVEIIPHWFKQLFGVKGNFILVKESTMLFKKRTYFIKYDALPDDHEIVRQIKEYKIAKEFENSFG